MKDEIRSLLGHGHAVGPVDSLASSHRDLLTLCDAALVPPSVRLSHSARFAEWCALMSLPLDDARARRLYVASVGLGSDDRTDA